MKKVISIALLASMLGMNFVPVFAMTNSNESTKPPKQFKSMIKKSKKQKSNDYKYKCKVLNPNVEGYGTEAKLESIPGYKYIAIKIDKNRAGSKDEIILFRVNLNYNTWENIGSLLKTVSPNKRK